MRAPSLADWLGMLQSVLMLSARMARLAGLAFVASAPFLAWMLTELQYWADESW